MNDQLDLLAELRDAKGPTKGNLEPHRPDDPNLPAYLRMVAERKIPNAAPWRLIDAAHEIERLREDNTK